MGRAERVGLLDRPIRTAVAERAEPRAADVLVVDDDYVIRCCVADTLEMEGFAVATASNGQAALDLLQRERDEGLPPPSVILLDMRMPILDGWHFAERYRAMPGPHAPIVVVTAAHDADKRGAAIAAEAVVAKPFDIDHLIQVVLKRLTIRGFIVRDHEDLRPEFEKQVGNWLRTGELVSRQTVVGGLENAVDAFLGLLAGANVGKMLVRLSDDDAAAS